MLNFDENEKPRPALQCQTEQGKNTLVNSIAYLTENIPAVKDCPIGVDSFKGSIREFRLYLKAQRTLLDAGIILP